MGQNAGQQAELHFNDGDLQQYVQQMRRSKGSLTGCVVRAVPTVGKPPKSLQMLLGVSEEVANASDASDASDASTEDLDWSLSGNRSGTSVSADSRPPAGATADLNDDQLLGSDSVSDVRLREQLQRNRRLEQRLARLTGESAAALSHQADRHAEQVRAVTAELRAMRADSERLCGERQAEHEHRMRELSVAADGLRTEHAEQCARWQRDRWAADAQAADLLAQVQRLNELNAQLLHRIGERDVRIEALSGEGAALVERREQLSVERATAQQCLAAVQASVAEHERVRAELGVAGHRLEGTVRGLRTQVDILETARGGLRAETKEGLMQLQQVSVVRRQMEAELKRAEAKVAEVLAESMRLAESQEQQRNTLVEAERVQQSLDGILIYFIYQFV